MSTEKYTKESANVHSTEYNKETKDLFVTFKSFKDASKTTQYVYSDVPEELWERLKQAESLGGFINREVVKGGFSYKKV